MQGISLKSRGVAVLGTGSAGMRHLAAVKRRFGMQPVAIPLRAGRRPEMEILGYATAATVQEAVENFGVELCIVATDTDRHYEDGLSVLASHAHLLVEKPMCAHTGHAQSLWLRAQAAKRELYVGCVLRASRSLNAFRNKIARLGRIHAVRIECQSYLPDWRPERSYRESYSSREAEGGVLRDLIHEIDYAGWLFGWPGRLRARLTNEGRLGIDSEESADLEWMTPQGAVLSMRLDYLTRPPRRRIMVFGEEGTGEWDGIRHTVRLCLEGQPSDEIADVQSLDDLFEAQAQAVVDALAGISDSRLASGLDGVRALAVCEAARRASDCRAEEQVLYP